ncbi:MAG: AI-2E family transporter [Calothrix sp. FI2-JRJ7]|jgi:predicted PurR-regulated permease PerM|nr:AI-2E family transporter [Calothrix sp. FI2-JRJ7]
MRRSATFKNLLFYGLSGPIIALNVWILSQLFNFFQHPITILSVAAILAFLLNYLVKFFERAYLSRTQAVTLVLLVTLMVFVILGVTLVPVIIDQATQLLNKIPNLLTQSQSNLLFFEKLARERRLPLDFTVVSKQINANIQIYIQNIVQQVASGAVGFASSIVLWILDFILVIVLAFYMLLYGDTVWFGLSSLLPDNIREPLTKSILLNFHYFFLSQILLALFMTASLIPIFLVLQVPFTLLFAIIIGISQLVPVIGATLGIGLVTLLVLLQNWSLALQVGAASMIMQQVKDNFLAPRLIGNFIGLNPLWIFVAILMGFEIAGLFGTIVAIPIAGTIKGTYDTYKASKLEDK